MASKKVDQASTTTPTSLKTPRHHVQEVCVPPTEPNADDEEEQQQNLLELFTDGAHVLGLCVDGADSVVLQVRSSWHLSSKHCMLHIGTQAKF